MNRISQELVAAAEDIMAAEKLAGHSRTAITSVEKASLKRATKDAMRKADALRDAVDRVDIERPVDFMPRSVSDARTYALKSFYSLEGIMSRLNSRVTSGE